MNTTVKRIILIFTLLCVVLLVVFCVELLLLNRSVENPEATPPEPPPAEVPPVEPEIPPAQPEDETPPSDEPPQPPPGDGAEGAGTRYELALVSDVTLVLYVDDEVFELEDMEQTWIFNYMDGSAKFEISPVYLPQGAAVYANSFLDGYLNGEPYNIRGARPIGNSPISGIYATGATEDAETVSAWISAIETVDGDNMGMVVVMTHSDDEGRDAILSALDTMTMITAADGTTPDNAGDTAPANA